MISFKEKFKENTNFVSVYYVEYGEDDEDLQEIANILLKRDKIEKAGLGNMNTFCLQPPQNSHFHTLKIL